MSENEKTENTEDSETEEAEDITEERARSRLANQVIELCDRAGLPEEIIEQIADLIMEGEAIAAAEEA